MKTLHVIALSASLLLSAVAAEARPLHLCPMIYRPVCAATPTGHHKTFSNSCVARNAHAHILYNGPCRFRHR